MKLYLSDQSANFNKHLNLLKTKAVMSYEIALLKESSSTKVIDIKIPFEKINIDPFFDYQIFPENILTSLPEWKMENRKMKSGDTIVQQVHIPPSKLFSQKLIFGVRIKEIITLENKKGYSYETLEGHVEKGISTFTIEKLENNKIIFKIHTLSIPGNTLSKLLGSCISVPYQNFCTAKALENIKQKLELLNK